MSFLVAEISFLKLLWTVSASIGVMVTFALFSMAVTDYRLLVKRKLNSWRQYVGSTSIVIFSGGLLTQLIYLTAGILALTQPNTGSSLTIRHVTQALFVFGAVSSIILAITIFYRRVHILDIIEEAISKERNGGDTPPN